MGKLLELREKREAAWEKAKAFLEEKQGVTDILSPEDSAAYDKMEAEIVDLGKEIERLERLEAFEGSFRAANRTAVVNEPGKVPGTATGRKSAEYSEAFWNAMRGRKVENDLAVGTDTAGGYLVPDEFERTLVQSLEEFNIMRTIARVIRTSSGELKIPVVATKGTASWVDEAAQIPTSDGSFGQVTLDAYKLGTIVKVSKELLQDSAFPLDSFLAQDFGRRIGSLEEEAFLVGDGAKKPTGIFAATGGGQVGATAASATDITFDEVMDLYHSLKSPYRNKAVFVTNDLTVKTLRKVKSTDGQYLWQPSLTAGTPDTLLGRPVYVSSFAPTIDAGASVLAFGDFSYYWIGDRQGRTFERLNELYSETDQVGFKATQRVDGKLILPEAVKILKMAAASGDVNGG